MVSLGDLTHRQACEQLSSAETEGEVSEILQHSYYKNAKWKPLGGVQNNYGIVENQQANSVGALTEIVVNSLDAIILKRYNQKYGSSDNPPEFSGMKDAAADMVSEDDETLVVESDGHGDQINLTIADSGKGQPNAHFESRFLGFLEPGKIKQGYSFLQGQYGMGSTGVLPFCGDSGYKLIASSAWDAQREWSWTIIRQNRKKNSYEYLTIDGDIPKFDGEFRGQEFGTVIKLYNYNLPASSHVGYGLRRYLDRYLLETPVPITLRESRSDKSSKVSSFNTRGMLENLERRKELVLEDTVVNYSFDDSTLGDRDVRIVIFRHDDELSDSDRKAKKNYFVGGQKHTDQALFFTINSQTHGDLGRTFIKNRSSRPRIAKDMLVFVDFTDLGASDKVDIFPASRDRLRDGKPAESLKQGLEDILKNNETIKEEEIRRRQRLTEDEEDEKVQHVLESIIGRNPSLKKYFATGQKTHVPDVDSPEPKISLEYIPDNFKIIQKYKNYGDYTVWDDSNEYRKRMPVNQSGYQRFELNANDDYFDRAEHQGELQVTPSDIVKSRSINNGILTLGIEPLSNAKVGQVLPVTVQVNRPGEDSLAQTLEIEYTEAVERDSSSNSNSPPNLGSIDLPETHRVWKDDWDEFGFDEHSALQIDQEEDGLVFWINMDCSGLQEFIARHNLRDAGKEQVKQIFETGITLYGLSQYIELKSEFGGTDVEAKTPADDLVAATMRGTAQVLLDQNLSEEDIEDLSF